MSVMDVAGHPGRECPPVPTRADRLPDDVLRSPRAGRLPQPLSRCQRIVAVTVRLPEFLLSAAGTVQRLDAAGVTIELLELAWLKPAAERAAAAALDRLELGGLTRHRLAMQVPFGLECTGDVVAAMSELIGFDPEPGLMCLVPGTGDSHRSAQQAVEAAAALVGDAYRMRTIRYAPAAGARSAAVELDVDEWRRKCDSLAACAPDVAPLSGRRELFAG